MGRPPTLFSGYWEAPEETDALFRDDWFLTGDRATRDDDGYLWFVGRSDDVIVSAAYRIGPFEVESALLEHAAVAESAVVGVPDDDRGQIVKAFVVLRPGQEPGDRLVAGAPGARQGGHRPVQVSARDRVRGRASEDRERKDPARRAAPAPCRARGGAPACALDRPGPRRGARPCRGRRGRACTAGGCLGDPPRRRRAHTPGRCRRRCGRGGASEDAGARRDRPGAATRRRGSGG